MERIDLALLAGAALLVGIVVAGIVGRVLGPRIDRVALRWSGCTGYVTRSGRIVHDGDTCPLHEA